MRKGICIYRKYFLLKRIILIKNLVTLHLKPRARDAFLCLLGCDLPVVADDEWRAKQSGRSADSAPLFCMPLLYSRFECRRS